MRIIIIAFLFLILFSCANDPQATFDLNNSEIRLDLLFEHDGCKVYRFYDNGQAVYWSDCRGHLQTSHYQQTGKTGHTVYVKAINIGAK